MTTVVFLEEAEDEFLEAIRYYTEHSWALGVDFVTEVQRAVILRFNSRKPPRWSDLTCTRKHLGNSPTLCCIRLKARQSSS